MGRLRAALQAKYSGKEGDVKIHTPRNLETLKLTFRGERVAKVCPVERPLIASQADMYMQGNRTPRSQCSEA